MQENHGIHQSCYQPQIKPLLRILLLMGALLLFATFSLEAEQVRGEVEHTLIIDESYSNTSVSIGLRELCQIRVESTEFLQGIVVQVESPRAALQFRESFLLSVYSNASPPPREDFSNYSANKIYSDSFPSAQSTFVDIPLRDRGSWERSTLNSSIVTVHPQPADYPLLLSIDPIMKGIPSNVSQSRFKITLKPVLIDKGALLLKLPKDVDRDDIQIHIDGNRQEQSSARFILSTGVHKLTVESDLYLTYSKSIGIEKARTTKLEAVLEPKQSSIRFEAPEDAVVFFNGEQIEVGSGTQLQTDPGEHVVLVRIGDYSVSKKIDIKGGKNYKVSLFFDILVNDN
ncbi:MAG: hypothetical protein U5P10_08090 [Spirochaetia bacterium]|nr:hypothetical protein [Spirochaetia bacterium]